jgi:hypothetical protein
MIVGYSVRRAEKVGIKKGVYVFIKNFIKVMFRIEIKEDYNKENYS